MQYHVRTVSGLMIIANKMKAIYTDLIRPQCIL